MADDTYSRGYRNDPPGRGGTGTPGQATDPLTELARLIGESDPFAPDAGHHPDGRASDPHAAEWRTAAPHNDPHNDPHDETVAPYEGLGGMADPQPGSGPYPGSEYRATSGHVMPADPHLDMGYGDSRAAQGDYGAPYDAAEHAQGADEDDGRYYEDPPGARRRGGLITAAALIGLAVIGTAGAFAYRAVFSSSGPPAVIARDAGPNKIVPATQNTDNSSNKQIYDRAGDRGQNEKIVSREEQPLNPADPARGTTRPPAQSLAAAMSATPGGVPARPANPPDTSALAPSAPGGGEPKKIRTVTIKSDQSPGDAAHPAAPPRPVASPATAQPPAAARPAPATPSAPLSLSPQGGASAAPSPPARSAALAPPPPAAAAGDSAGGYFVQVAAQKTQEEAQASYRGIQAKYASVLSGRQPVIRRKDLGSKGVFYGAQVGPFSREDAVQLCDSLKSAGATCMIQRN